MNNKLKTGVSLVILGNLLYLSYVFFSKNEVSNFGEFSSCLLLGMSIGINIVGIIIICKSVNNKDK